MSPIGTKLTSRSDGAKSAFGGKPDILCSFRAFPLLTQLRRRARQFGGVSPRNLARGRSVNTGLTCTSTYG
jgi:hypothetical protein